jgi:hypothetical protein
MFEQVLDYLTNPADTTNHAERQEVLLPQAIRDQCQSFLTLS